MSSYDEETPNRRRFTFAGLLDGLRSTFFREDKPIVTATVNVSLPLPQPEIIRAKVGQAGSASRMESAANLLSVWNGDLRKLVERKLRENFHPENYARMQLMIHTASNPLQRVVREMSMTYDSPPTREVGGTSVGETYMQLGLDAVFETLEWYARFLPCVWIRPYVRYNKVEKDENGQPVANPEDGELDFIIYTPDQADVVVDPDNKKHAVAFFYFSEELVNNKLVKRVNFWTPTQYVKLDDEWKVVSQEENTLGVLPVVPLRLGVPTGNYYLDGTASDLYEGTLELCVLKTIQNARARDAGFKQMVISGADQEQVPADQVMGGPTPIYTNEGGAATVLDMQPNIEQWTDLCEKRELALSTKYGISVAEYKAEGAPQSGFAKKLDRDKVLKENQRTRKFFLQTEKALYKLIRAVLAEQPVAGVSLPEGDLEVDFAEPTFTEDPKVQAEVDAIRIKMNVDSILDILRRENPDLTDEELMEKAAENKRINELMITGGALSVVDLLAGLKGEAPAGGETPPGEDNNAPPTAFPEVDQEALDE